ncbi:MAG TPA: lamin tail domain-containing protein, partial [Anaerolineales bacterium]
AGVSIGSWTIRSSVGCGTNIAILVTMPSNTLLKPGQHYLAAATGSSVTNADKTFTAGIDDNGGVGLFNYAGTVQDMAGMCAATTYREGNFLAPLLEENQNLNQSYERKPVGATSCYDTNDNFRDFELIQPADPQNSDSPIVLCTGVVPFTPTFTPTRSPTRTPTRAPTAIPGKIAINEFLPHPRTDWNGDGTIDTGDEYIEIINMGTESINVANWKLDNGAGSTNFFLLPNLTLLPRQIEVFYHADTGLGLSDMGSTVRLLKPDGRTADIFNYPLVNAADRTWCRLPDGSGAWAFVCYPTPGKPNEPIKSGTPGTGTGEGTGSICVKNLAPQTVLTAECNSPGGMMWGEAWNSEIWLKSLLKWGVFVE